MLVNVYDNSDYEWWWLWWCSNGHNVFLNHHFIRVWIVADGFHIEASDWTSNRFHTVDPDFSAPQLYHHHHHHHHHHRNHHHRDYDQSTDGLQISYEIGKPTKFFRGPSVPCILFNSIWNKCFEITIMIRSSLVSAILLLLKKTFDHHLPGGVRQNNVRDDVRLFLDPSVALQSLYTLHC